MIKIVNVNEAKVRVECDAGTAREISEGFSFRVPNYQFMPSYKHGIWDGYIRLLDLKSHLFPKGLVPDLIKFCRQRNYKVTFGDGFIDPFKKVIPYSHENFNLPFEPRDYQIEAVERCLTKKRQIILSSTGSGKSLSISLLCRHLESEGRILIVVPTISLVQQMYGDMADYFKNEVGFEIDKFACMIYSGQDLTKKTPVMISTWQSLYKKKKDFFDQFTTVICDEVHQFKSNATSGILDKCHNAFYRFGFTGTLDDSLTHEMQLRGLIGPVTRVSSTKDLIDKDVLSKLDTRAIVLEYSKDELGKLTKPTYVQELDWIVQNEKRLDFVSKLANYTKGNTLVLFQYVEKHGKPMAARMHEIAKTTGKDVYLIYGGTKSDHREHVRKLCEVKDNIIIVSSYQLFSTGISIKNLHNIVLASPTKSKIRLLQSIGRGLRKNHNKTSCKLYDITDDLSCGKKTKNQTFNHFIKRYEIYTKEGFDVKLKRVQL